MPRPMTIAILGLPAIVATLPLAAVLLFRDGGAVNAHLTDVAPSTTVADSVNTYAISDALPVAYRIADSMNADCGRGEAAPDADS